MRVRGIFARIFLAFWLTGAILGVASIVAAMLLRHPARQISPQISQLTTRAYGTIAVASFEESGAASATQYLREVAKATQISGCLLDLAGTALAGDDCIKLHPAARDIQNGSAANAGVKSEGWNPSALALDSASGRHYMFISSAGHGPRLYPTYQVQDVGLRIGIAIIVSGIVCYFVTTSLTRPILELRSVTRQLASGKLGARASDPLATRNDELGEFARDFNILAERSQGFIRGQKQLLYDVSHELRSPLARMSVSLDILRTRDEQDAIVEQLDYDLQQLNDMLGRILTVAKLESVETIQTAEQVGLEDLVESIARDAAFEAQKRGVHVETHGTDSTTIVQGDQNLLRSAIENVVRNAVRYSPASSGIEIRLSRIEVAGTPSCSIVVRDYGPGVPEAELKRIFKPFYRVSDAGSRSLKGVGLGLAIADRIVSLHCGAIKASNAPDGGLQVEITFPIVLSSSEKKSIVTTPLTRG